MAKRSKEKGGQEQHKRQRLSDLSCLFCKSFRAAEEDIKTKSRFCDTKRKLVSADSLFCDDFELAQFFYCEEYYQEISPTVCLYRRAGDGDPRYHQAYEECPKCKTGRHLFYYCNGLPFHYEIKGVPEEE